MRAKTQELLYLLLWTADKLCRPSYRHIGESFEGWAYRNGLLRELHELERQKFLESREPAGRTRRLLKRLYRLTEKGRLKALEGRDPEQLWSRPWDQHWRMVVFDFPEVNSSNRKQLRRYLRRNGFGNLQKSVWVTPDPIQCIHPKLQQLNAGALDVGTLLSIESMPSSAKINQAIVDRSWNFKNINELYERSLSVLEEFSSQGKKSTTWLQSWATRERMAWKMAMQADPLLPAQLLPKRYLGKKAWKMRVKTFSQAGDFIKRLGPNGLL